MAKEKSKLLQALEFVALAQRETGAPYQTHCQMGQGFIVAFDGVVAIGHLIDEHLDLCPHTATMVEALSRCDGAFSLTQTSNGDLSVKSGRFRATVRCANDAVIKGIYPDNPCGYFTVEVINGLKLLSPFVPENAHRVVMASIFLRSGSMLATDGQFILEYQHGLEFPPTGFLIPKPFISALLKIKKETVSFGYSDTSLTVYFADNSWIRTQLYKEQWPDCDGVLNRPNTPTQLPDGFFEAVRNVSAFTVDNRIRFRNNVVMSHDSANEGACNELDGVIANVTLTKKHISLLDGMINAIDMNGTNAVTYFYGERLRGALAQMKE